MNQLLEYALKYAEIGWKIIPIVPHQKIPLTKHGIKDATDHPDTIRAWWKKWPNANIAVACGKPSGVYVVDVDVSEAGDVNGKESLVTEFDPLPVTIQQYTPRGGFHAFYKTDNPPANRNSFRPGIDIRGDGYYVVVAPSIHPNGGIYAWKPRCAPWELTPAEFPDFMRPTTKAPWAASVGSIGPTRPEGVNSIDGHSGPIGADILKRASLYLAQCDPAIQGCGGHDKLLWAAVALVHGFLLSDGQALDLLMREYNPRCVPPWDFGIPKDDKDFRRKVTEARKLTPIVKPRGWLLEDNTYKPVDPAQVAAVPGLIKGRKTTVTYYDEFATFSPNISHWIQKGGVTIDKEREFLIHPTGLLGEICEWINETAISPQPFLTLACALTFCGVLFGRKIRDELDSRTNLYCIGIASSSAGKNHAPKQIRKICQEAGCLEFLGGINTTGDAAMESRLEKHPASLFMWDEIGFLLSYASSGVSKTHLGLIPFLMQAYSSASNIFLGREYVDSENQRTIVQPCCCIYGSSTPERFAPSISREQLQDGFLARCLIFHTNDDPLKNREQCSIPVPFSIATQVKAWHARQIGETDGKNIGAFAVYHNTADESYVQPPEQLVVRTESDAEKIFIALDDKARDFGKINPTLSILWRKGEENARKIALILAASESFDSPYITASIADYSCRLIQYLLLSFGKEILPTIVSGQIESQKQKLLEIIKKTGIKGCPAGGITRAARWSNKRQRDALLADLVEAQEIITQSNGKSIYFWTVENYRSYLEQQEKESKK